MRCAVLSVSQLFLAAFAEHATLVDSTAAQQNSSRCLFSRESCTCGSFARQRSVVCCECFAASFALVRQLLRVVSTRGEAETAVQFASLRSSDMLLRGATRSANAGPALRVRDACQALLNSRAVLPSLVDGVSTSRRPTCHLLDEVPGELNLLCALIPLLGSATCYSQADHHRRRPKTQVSESVKNTRQVQQAFCSKAYCLGPSRGQTI